MAARVTFWLIILRKHSGIAFHKVVFIYRGAHFVCGYVFKALVSFCRSRYDRARSFAYARHYRHDAVRRLSFVLARVVAGRDAKWEQIRSSWTR